MSRQHDREALAAAQQSSKARPKAPPAPEPEEDLRSSVGNSGMGNLIGPGVSDTIEAEIGGGKPLASTPAARETKGKAEDVRIHDDGTAADLSRELGAVAFTFGRDIFLAGNAPALESSDGQAMLRHELTHVDQQAESGTTRPKRVSSPDSPAEQQATRVQHGDTGAGASAGASAVHRQEEEEEEMMLMRSDTVHRQEEPEEEELLTMPADTVHRQEEEELVDAELAGPSSSPAAEPTMEDEAAAAAPANPALAGLFQTTVIDKYGAAVSALESEPPDAETALGALNDAWNGVSSLMPAYEESDPPLASELGRVMNAFAMFYETVEPHVHGARDLPDVHAAMTTSNLPALVEGVRDRLH